jgi:hypothetical protein
MGRTYKGRSASPRDSKRGCLCRDGSYSRDCCDGSYYAQGVGSVTKTDTTYYYTATSCSGGTKHIHTHGIELNVNSVYYLFFKHNNHSGCYTISATRNNGHFEVYKVTNYNDCNACISAN